ncbi:MAG TPA: NAD(P)H-hydrate dehydratase [Candidatus Baltobacteraceae bacterium]|nr:NAD(P)H-hydrate dehydratase [Candidatus Baltobacteraceae bacterium]
MIVLTPAQMRDADAQACAVVGDDTLMQAAGRAVAAAMRDRAKGRRAIAFAGSGNNGGDAFAALAELSGFECTIYAQPAGEPSRARKAAEQRARAAGVRVEPFPQTPDDAAMALREADVVAVGLAGTAARYPLPEAFANVVRAVNDSNVPAIAIDIPPGVDGETGAVHEPALRAAETVTLGAMKSGLLLCEDASLAGSVSVADIGMPPETLRSQQPLYAALTDGELHALLPRRASNSDKRSAGAPFIVAGSEQFPGAAVLCAMGSARAGAGYVTVATPSAAAHALRMHLIEQVVVTIDPSHEPGAVVDDLLEMSARCSSLAIGPGLGLDDRTGEIVRGLLKRTTLPAVADASALFHLSKHLGDLRGKQLVLTPHAGEFARLSGRGTVLPGTRAQRLREFVDRTGITTLLKGDRTLIYDGSTMHVNTTGTPALATAGTGDVLTGIIATLLSQGLSVTDAARAGAHWHGLAARSAERQRVRGVIARDVYEALGPSVSG